MIISVPNMSSRADRVRQYAPEVFGTEIVTHRSTFTTNAPGTPQVLLVDQESDTTLLPHYHASDQYQIFIHGDGKLGSHAVQPVSVHYTNQYTGYGPIIAGKDGVSYYVLRPSFDRLGLGQYLFRTELREKLKAHPGRKRTFVAENIPIMTLEQLRQISVATTEELFAVAQTEPDGGTLCAVIRLGPLGQEVAWHPSTGGGQFFLVLSGSLRVQEAALEAPAGVAVTSDEQALQLVAGPHGAQVLAMQYPKRA